MLISGSSHSHRISSSGLWLLWLSVVISGYQWLSVVISGYQMLSVVIAWLSVVLDCLSNVSIDSVHDYI